MTDLLPGFEPDSLGYFHPADTAQVISVVRAAKSRGLTVRVRGAGHSIPAAVVTDGWLRGDHVGGVDLVLDRLRDVAIDRQSMTVTLGAGVRFGVDPIDPHPTEGLCVMLDREGLALPNLGGVSHQTVVGFLATGSAGGSVKHDLQASVRAITLVDATGKLRTYKRGDPSFGAVGVSLGVLGVVVSLTLDVQTRYDVVGTETIVAQADAPFRLFVDGDAGIEGYLRRTDYARLLWWPQRGVERLVLWEVKRLAAGESARTSRYEPLPAVLGSTLPMQVAATATLVSIGRWRQAVRAVAGSRVVRALEAPTRRLKGPVYRAFVPATPHKPQSFAGSWHDVLPMDADMDERLMTTTFTEVWVPLARAGEAMRRMHEAFESQPAMAGRFAIELYASPASQFWMSPAHDGACLRVNVFWLEHDPGDPRDDLFPALWAALEPLEPRYHWGKLVPRDLRSLGARLAPRFSRWEDFGKLRQKMDPRGMFLTSAWSAILGVAGAPSEPVSPLPRRRKIARYRIPFVGWPMPFALEPSDASLLDEADLIYDVFAIMPGPARLALAMISDERSTTFTPLLRRWQWLTPGGARIGALAEEQFLHMGIQQRTLEHTESRIVARIERCSAPLASRMCLIVDAHPHEGDLIRVRLRMAVDVLPAMRPLKPLLVPPFTAFMQGIVDGLGTAMTVRSGRANG